MSHLLTCAKVSKTFSAHPLFEEISLTIEEGDRIGLIGPNGAGKSTLLKILAGVEAQDSGEIISRKGLRVSYLQQSDFFDPALTVHQILFEKSDKTLSEAERHQKVGEVINQIGLEDDEQKAGDLSGGWRKRLAIATAIITDPDLMLLDEPTNHLDLEGIVWLEQFLLEAPFAVVVISHDRTFLENATNRTIEISRRYPKGFIAVNGNYSEFLERREETLEQLSKQEQSLQNVVRREVEWLRRGAKARSTKQNARIDRALELTSELADAKSRARAVTTVEIDFSSTGRQTKQFVDLENVSKGFGDKKLISSFTYTLLRGTKLGIVGPNGAGKSTFLKLLSGELDPDKGKITWAVGLKIVTFEQQRNSLDKKVTLRRYLAPDSDSVVFQDSLLHIASYARRFRFGAEQLDVPVGSLSGGEQARLLIAKLMLQPADLLLLDEPTNDLDIDTLQVLEDNLIGFSGAVVLITHDRFMIENVCTRFLAVESGSTEFFSSYSQWRDAQRKVQKKESKGSKSNSQPVSMEPNPKIQKELQQIQRSIEKSEKQLKLSEDEISRLAANPASPEYAKACQKFADAQREIDQLFLKWQELEEGAS